MPPGKLPFPVCDGPFESAKFSVNFAAKEIWRLMETQAAFIENVSPKMETEYDPITCRKLYMMRFGKAAPDECREAVINIINNLRKALDQATTSAVCVLCDVEKAGRDVKFPIGNHPNQLRSFVDKMSIPDELRPVLMAFRAYPTNAQYEGGNDALVALSAAYNNSHHLIYKFAIKSQEIAFKDGGVSLQGKIYWADFLGRWDARRNALVFAETDKNGLYQMPGVEIAFYATLDNAGDFSGRNVIQCLGIVGDWVIKIVKEIELEVNLIKFK